MKLVSSTAFTCLLAAVPVVGINAETASEVFAQVSPSVVVVISLNEVGAPLALGSGVVVAKDEVVTNCHVVKDGGTFQVKYNNHTYPAQLLYYDPQRDVCALSVPDLNAPAVKLGNTQTLKIGTTVYAVGAPEGLESSISEGIVSGLRTQKSDRYIQTTAAISHGSSGGGLFDDRGRLLGLTTFYLRGGEQLNFAIPVEWVENLPVHCKSLSKTADKLMWKSLHHGPQIDYAGAITATIDMLCSHPQLDTGWAQLGDYYYRVHQYSNAYGALRKALTLIADDSMSWYTLGRLYFRAKRFDMAIYAFQQEVRFDSNNPMAWYGLGASYQFAGKHEKAMAVYKKLQTMSPKYAHEFLTEVIQP